MGTLFYQIWRVTEAKDKKLLIGFLTFDIIVWNLIIVPIAGTYGLILPQVTMEHINSILGMFGSNPAISG